MKIIRFKRKSKIDWGILIDDVISVLAGDIFAGITETEEKIPLSEVKVLPPVLPSKIIGVGRNYYKYIEARKAEIPPEPLIFFKPSTAVIGHLDHIVCPERIEEVVCEGELAVVIGKEAKNVTESHALDYVFGYTIVNDVTARDYIKHGIRSGIDKAFDTFCPFGPVIATGLDPDNLNLEIRLNGEVMKASNTDDLVFSAAQMISFISSAMTLLPGDLVVTGTPWAGVIKAGDTVEIEIEGIGVLKNFVS